MPHAGLIMVEVVLAIGAVAGGVWVLGRYLDRQAEKERAEMDSLRDEDDDDRLVSR